MIIKFPLRRGQADLSRCLLEMLLKKQWEPPGKPGSVQEPPRRTPPRQPFLWTGGYPPVRRTQGLAPPNPVATYPQAWSSRPQALAYLVLLRMEVARFTRTL